MPSEHANSKCDPSLPNPDRGPVPGNYDGGSFFGVLFTADSDGDSMIPILDLQRSTRWGYAPVGAFGPGSSVSFVITDFAPVFIETLAADCNATTCTWTRNAGEAQQGTLKNNKRIVATIAVALPKDALPPAVNENAPGQFDSFDYILFR